jgi:endo-1,4-beta-D-glucanase Y
MCKGQLPILSYCPRISDQGPYADYMLAGKWRDQRRSWQAESCRRTDGELLCDWMLLAAVRAWRQKMRGGGVAVDGCGGSLPT